MLGGSLRVASRINCLIPFRLDRAAVSKGPAYVAGIGEHEHDRRRNPHRAGSAESQEERN